MKIKLATLEITNTCNFFCKHCYLPKDRNEADLDDWKKVIELLKNDGVEKIIFTGGEPLLYRWFSDLYLYANSLGYKISIFTNGSYLSSRHKEIFEQYPPDSVSITLYGKSNEEYREFTGKPLFDMVIKNIEFFEEKNIRVYKGITLCNGMDNSDTISFIKSNAININTYLMPNLSSILDEKLRLSADRIIFMENGLGRKFQEKPLLRRGDELYSKKCQGGLTSIYIDQDLNVSMCAINRNMKLPILEYGMKVIKERLLCEHERVKNNYFNSKCGKCEFNAACRSCPLYEELEMKATGKNDYFCSLMMERKKKLDGEL